MQIRFVLVAIGFLLVEPNVFAAKPVIVPSEYRALVPHRLLALLHAPEVHAELKLSGKQVADLEALFAEIDSSWFQSRIQPLDKQLQVNDLLDERAHAWLAKHLSAQQRSRLHQLEMQAQSVRMLLRTDLATELELNPRQQRQFADLAKATDAALLALREAPGKQELKEELQHAATDAAQAEQAALKSVLTPEQHQRLWKSLGEPFDTGKLQRIYPMAPEFVAVDQWINSEPLTLKELRGKVVLVHFYAFQCHNCQANFEIYRRWHDRLRKKGVVVVGIQTPETSRERDPDAVRAAAAERKLEFPILIDLESENWKAWGNTMWPTVYVVDKKGYLRHWWQGELNWEGATADKSIEQVVELALRE